MVNLNKKQIPTTPGVYFFKNPRTVLYIGKASNLKSRVSSYFQKSTDLSPAKQKLVSEASSVVWKKTGSEIEALLLEAHYIKKYQPKYNILLRDDKTYLSIKITDEEFPRVLTTRKIEKDGTYFGPFTDARAVKETLRVLRKFFPYRTTCKPLSGRACLDAHLGLCPGVCVGKISVAEYKKNIRHIKMFLESKRKNILTTLKKDLRHLKQYSNNLKIIGVLLEEKDDIKQIKKLESQIRWLEKVIEMSHVLSFSEKVEGDVIELGKILNIKKPIHRIEGYDISNIMGTLATASMVVFIDGIADKSEYKKFKIKTVRGANDVAMLKETLKRRFLHTEWPTPDLVMVDGGRPQLNAALEIWKELNLKIPLISLAKRYEEIFVPEKANAIVLERTSSALHLVQRVRDEAHRFCKSYHKLLRRKKLVRQ